MSNARKPRTAPLEGLDETKLPPRPWLIPSPDRLTFEDQFRIKAATGVDVLNPVIRGYAVAACLWLAARDWPVPLTWEQSRRFNLDDVELDDGDEELALDEDGEEDPADPTDGSATP